MNGWIPLRSNRGPIDRSLLVLGGSVSTLLLLAACGGGGDAPPSSGGSPSTAQRVAADTSNRSSPATGSARGAFSSPVLFGFYPWIDAGRRHYGLLARTATNGYYESVQCGRLIRKAWLTGVAQ